MYVLRFVFSEITKLVQTHQVDKVIANCVGNSDCNMILFSYMYKKMLLETLINQVVGYSNTSDFPRLSVDINSLTLYVLY